MEKLQIMIITANSLVTTGAANTALFVEKTNKAGNTSVGLMSQKDYGAEHNLKGQALKKAHAEYRREKGVSINQNISAALAGGTILAQKVTTTKTGFNVTFVRPESLGLASAAEVNKAVKVATDEITKKAVAVIMAKVPGITEAEALAML